MPQPITELPPGYQEVQHLVATEDKTLLWLNLLSLVPLVIASVLMLGWWVLIARARGSMPGGDLPWWAGVGLLILILPLHEILHGLAIRWTGHRFRLGAKLHKGVLYATADGALFRPHEFIIIALTPVVVISLVGLLLMWVVPDGIAMWMAIGIVINAGSSIGDFWMADVVRKYPASALVKDEEDGIRIYAR